MDDIEYDDSPSDEGPASRGWHICDDDGFSQPETCPACWILTQASEPPLVRPPV